MSSDYIIQTNSEKTLSKFEIYKFLNEITWEQSDRIIFNHINNEDDIKQLTLIEKFFNDVEIKPQILIQLNERRTNTVPKVLFTSKMKIVFELLWNNKILNELSRNKNESIELNIKYVLNKITLTHFVSDLIQLIEINNADKILISFNQSSLLNVGLPPNELFNLVSDSCKKIFLRYNIPICAVTCNECKRCNYQKSFQKVFGFNIPTSDIDEILTQEMKDRFYLSLYEVLKK